MKRYLVLLMVVILPALTMGSSIPNSGEVAYTMSALLTKSTANAFPSSGALPVSDEEYFGIEVMCDDASGDAISGTVSVQTSFDGDNWVTYTQTVIYPSTAASAATMAVTGDGTYYHASVKPLPCPYLRFLVTEAGAQEDVTCTIKLFNQ